MRKFTVFTVLFVVSTEAAFAQQAKVFVDQYIVQRNPSVAAAYIDGATPVSEFASLVTVQRGSGALATAASLSRTRAYDEELAGADCAEILKDRTIRTCEPNYVQYMEAFPNDPFFTGGFDAQWGLYSPFADGISSFDARAHLGWNTSVGSMNVVVGILDSGINYLHPDLIPNLWRNTGEIPANGVDDDQNGYVDDIVGIDAHLGNGDPFDCNGHGSHVAGIIGAKGNNGIGISGAVWNVQLASSRHAVDCGDSVSTLAAIKGMEYFYNLKKRGVNIVAVNASYGGKNPTQAEKEAIQRLASVNIVFVAAAGNDGVNVDVDPRYPAAYGVDNMVTVANVDNYNSPNSLNSGSNYGSGRVHIGAPGTQILSTVQSIPGFPEQYDYKTGTSMAAPMVAGAVALLAAQRPAFVDYRQFKQTLLGSAFRVNFINGRVSTGGILDLGGLMAAPDPADNCPSDPQKIGPGVCGCGAVDDYTDTDLDGALNCVESCPTDPSKTAPGSCGCGIPDADGNLNGILDCVDAGIQSVTPEAPKASKKKKKINVEMTPREGATYLVTIVRQVKKGKNIQSSTTTLYSETPKVSFKAPSSKSKLMISYQYAVGGPTSFLSAPSASKQLSIK